MKNRNPLIAVLIFACSLGLAARIHGQEKAADVVKEAAEAVTKAVDDGMSGEEIAANVKPIVEAELELLQRITEVPDSTVVAIRKKLQPAVEQQAKVEAAKKKGRMFFVTRQLPNWAFETFCSVAKEKITDEGAYKAYMEDVSIRRKTARGAAVGSFVAAMNDVCGLTSSQFGKVQQRGEELFHKGRFDYGFFQMAGVPEVIKVDDLKDILTPVQIEAFENRGASANLAPTEFDAHDSRERIMAALRRVAACRIHRLHSEVKLQPGQRRKLELLSKKVVSDTTTLCLEAEQAYAEYIKLLQNGGEATPDEEKMRLARMSHGQLFDSSTSTWRNFVRSTLNAEQLKQMEAADELWQKLAWDTMQNQLFFRMSDQLRLTGKQQNQLRALITPRIKRPSVVRNEPDVLMTAFKPMLDIPDADYKKILGDDAWGQFSNELGQLRQGLERMEKEAKEATDPRK